MASQTNGEPTNLDILHAINAFSSETDTQMKDLRTDMKDVKIRLSKVEATMVTKDYLDDKLSDLKGDMVVLMRKEDRKVVSLIDLLVRKSVITERDAKQILSLEPFPQLSAQQ